MPLRARAARYVKNACQRSYGGVNKLIIRIHKKFQEKGFYAGTPDFSGCQNYTEVLYSAWVTNLQILLMMAGSGLSIAPT